MTSLRQAAQQALEACEQRLPLKGQAAIIDELNNLRAALAEPRSIQECYGDCPTNPRTCPNPCNFEGRPRPVQEPVAWRFHDGKMWCYVNHIADLSSFKKFEPLYTAPPQRKWTGLTEAERIDIIDDEITKQNSEHWALAQAIEAKLKEKNE